MDNPLLKKIEKDSKTEIAAIEQKISEVEAITPVNQEHRQFLDKWLSQLHKSEALFGRMLEATRPE